jgi:CubicO group peptidase (beta-lactamase class C family)
VADLLKARSGVYHPALYETEAMKARRPERGSHAPGSFYYYNNWDFNALGTIYEKAAGMSVFAAFEQHLAGPLQMEDFRLEDTQYVRGSDSIHPAYAFRMTARDMARFGLLFLHQGRWRDRQVVPADWVAESTRAYSAVAATNGAVYAGYGYLWWTDWQGRSLENVTLPPGTFSARGAGGHYILIAPALGLVIVHRVDTDKKDGPRVERSQFGTLVKLILEAMPARAATNRTDLSRPTKPTPEILDELVPRLMTQHHVPGVAIVGIENRRFAWERFYGVRRAGESGPVDASTVFEAASMSKLLMAYAALKLVEQGKLDLDRSLAEYLDKPYLPDEPRHRRITARMVLSHTTVFPNWRTNGWQNGGPLPLLHDPGTRFTYSGEGFLYLQRVVERITGTPIQSYLQKTLLDPLQMTNSSLVWQDRFSPQAAAGHDAQGEPLANRKLYHEANVAYSLYCTATDYAKLLLEMLAEDRSAPHSLSARSLDAMLTRTSVAEGRKPVARGGVRRSEQMHYGLGWAIDTTATGDRIHHSGSNGTGFRCYCEFDRRRGNGLVIMTNAVNGQQLWEDIMLAVGEP